MQQTLRTTVLHAPFRLDATPDEAVPHPGWRRARAAALAALARGDAAVLLGPPGTGKTLLLRDLARALRHEGRSVRLVERGEALDPAPGGDVLLVDEARSIGEDAFARLCAAGIPFVLAALPAFVDCLAGLPAAITPIALEPLPPEEVARFVAARLSAAGRSRDLLEPDATLALARHSAGLLRLVNALAGSAVFLAELEGAPRVLRRHVDEAAAMRDGAEEDAPAVPAGSAASAASTTPRVEAPPPPNAPDVLAEITAELARRTPAIALISDVPRSERSGVLKRLAAHLVRENIRVIRVDQTDAESIGIRRFCQLLVAASPSDASARDSAEHLATTFTYSRAGERGVALIVENADALSAEALAFTERLAMASGARPLRVQVLLVGSHSLESRLPEAGQFSVKKLACVAASQGRSAVGTARGRWTRPALAAFGCAAALIVVAAVASSDRDRESVSAEAALAARMTPARAAPTDIVPEQETSPVADHLSKPATLQPPLENAAHPVQPAEENGIAAEPSSVFDTSSSASSHDDVAIPPLAETYAVQVSTPAPSPTATIGQVSVGSDPLPQSAPEATPVGAIDTASPTSPVQPEAAAPSMAETANLASPGASPASPAEQVQPQAKPSPVAVAALLARGDELIAIGDVATARVVYERAASLKSGRGATSTGRTYDPRFLRRIGAIGVVPDPETAAAWYRKGAALGDESAAPLLGGLESRASQ